ncbi:hypothetical protein [Nitrosomonas ureae]|uniref:Uncharacterized protein n=1 Tax=Nitrosomonas ureae TaxID=44577 RepID=A0A286AGK9_9PROT|nr:hypothetical protein [Nitrosomonas ureae]SOD21033.1 hypothetical protein SAMN06297164_3113 [Nitrosomonas ureae]
MIALDHIYAISVDPIEANNELTILKFLRTGLASLAHETAQLEAPFREDRVFFYGFRLPLPPDKIELIPCYFHWFGTSLFNYARLVGFFEGVVQGKYSRDSINDSSLFETISLHCKSYVETVPEFAPVLAWRNKVFAHFALTAPRKVDSAALLDFSVMSPIGLFDGRFCVGNMIVTMQGGEAQLPQWSLTETFEKLAPRYWPDHGTTA